MQSVEDVVILVLAGSLVMLVVVLFVFFFIIKYYKKQKEFEIEKTAILKQVEIEKLQSTIEIKEDTFKHISSEIHDNVTQHLKVLGILVGSLPDTIENKSIISRGLEKAIDDLRDLSGRLDHKRLINIGIIEAIQIELALLEKSKKYTTELIIDTNIVSIADDKLIIVFRMIQESINNILKHAKANHVYVNITESADEDFILIGDNGQGFQVDKAKGTGLGLANIYTRIKLIGGEATIKSEIGKGTTTLIKIPKK